MLIDNIPNHQAYRSLILPLDISPIGSSHRPRSRNSLLKEKVNAVRGWAAWRGVKQRNYALVQYDIGTPCPTIAEGEVLFRSLKPEVLTFTAISHDEELKELLWR